MDDAEIVRLLAVNVMGWHKSPTVQGDYWCDAEGRVRMGAEKANQRDGTFLTDDGLACMVLDRMAADAFAGCIFHWQGQWCCCFMPHKQAVRYENPWTESDDGGRCAAPCRRRAICLAALEALGEAGEA